MMGASAAGTIVKLPAGTSTLNDPSAAEWNIATCTEPRSITKLAENGASHGTSTWQTGVTGPRTTVPVSRPVAASGPKSRHALSAISIANAVLPILIRGTENFGC